MGIRGQRPKALALRLIEGNPGHRPLPDEIPAPSGRPVKPKALKGRASKIWDEQLPLVPWLTEAESYLLGVYCTLAAEWEKDADHMQTSRITQLRVYASEMGISSTARARIGLNGSKKKDPADDYLT